MFDYTPFEDKATPCQEAGLPFQCRDILQVVSQDDPTWWQAKRVGDSNLRAGLIPSKQFQERYNNVNIVINNYYLFTVTSPLTHTSECVSRSWKIDTLLTCHYLLHF